MSIEDLLTTYYQDKNINDLCKNLYILNSLKIMSNKYNLPHEDFINTLIIHILEKNILANVLNDKQFFVICKNIAVDLIRLENKATLIAPIKLTNNKQTLAEYINGLCAKYNINKLQFSKIVGINYATLYRYINKNSMDKINTRFVQQRLREFKSQNAEAFQDAQYYANKFFIKYKDFKKTEIKSICNVSFTYLSLKHKNGLSTKLYYKYEKIMQTNAKYAIKLFELVDGRLARFQIANILGISERELSKRLIGLTEADYMSISNKVIHFLLNDVEI